MIPKYGTPGKAHLSRHFPLLQRKGGKIRMVNKKKEPNGIRSSFGEGLLKSAESTWKKGQRSILKAKYRPGNGKTKAESTGMSPRSSVLRWRCSAAVNEMIPRLRIPIKDCRPERVKTYPFDENR